MEVNTINSFRGKHFFLSNFSPCIVYYNGKKFPTVEHAFQAAKCVHEEEMDIFRFLDEPKDAKQWGKRVTLRPDWESVKVGIMKELLIQKFSTPKYNALLKETMGMTLVEGNNHRDTFWGVYNGKGLNNLGKLLMEVRDEICK